MNSVDFRRGARGGLFSTLCLAAAWCTLWMVWPEQGTSFSVDRHDDRVPHYFFLSQQNGSTWALPAVPFPLPSEHGFSGALRDDRVEPESLKPVRIDLASVLERSVSRRRIPSLAESVNLAAGVGSKLSDYEPPSIVAQSNVLSDKRVRQVGLELSTDLLASRAGFAVVLTDEGFRTVEPWIAKAHVEITRNGRASHVFLETPTQNSKVNSLVVRALYKSCLTNVTEEREGQVILSWGGQRRRESNP